MGGSGEIDRELAQRRQATSPSMKSFLLERPSRIGRAFGRICRWPQVLGILAPIFSFLSVLLRLSLLLLPRAQVLHSKQPGVWP